MARKSLLFILPLCFVLIFCSCAQNSVSSADGASTAAGNNTGSFDAFFDSITADVNYKRWTYSYSDDNQLFSYDIEWYETDTYSYRSVIGEADGSDYLIRYSPDSPDDTVEALDAEKWVNCVSDATNFSIERYVSVLNWVLVDRETVDATVDIYGESFESKRTTIEDDIYIDYLCRNGAWDAVALTTRSGETAVLEDFYFSDTLPQNSRFYPYLEAEQTDDAKALLVMSESMSPAVELGKVYFFDAKSTSSLEVGDIVLVYSQDYQAYIAHRIVEIKEDGSGFVLKGDNAPENDPSIVAQKDILGVLAESVDG